MLQIWQQSINRQILPCRLKRNKFIYRDSEFLIEKTLFPLILLVYISNCGNSFSRKTSFGTVLKLALLQDEIMKLAKSVFPAP